MKHTVDILKRNIFTNGYRKGKRAFSFLSEYKCMTIAGSLVFFLLLSLFPFLFWLVLLFGQTGLGAGQLAGLKLFDWADELLVFLLNNASGATTGASLFFLATTLFSSTSFFYHLRRSGELIYRTRRLKSGFKVRLSAALFTLLLLLFFALSGTLLVGSGLLLGRLKKWLRTLTMYTLLLTLSFFASWLLNHYICPYRVMPSDTVRGSAFTAVAWLGAAAAFNLYMRFASPERLYGALAVFIAFLIFLYWLMIVFTAGAIYNRHTIRRKDMEHKRL